MSQPANSFQSLGWAALKQAIRLQFPQVRHISTAQLASYLEKPDSPKPVVLLDARTPEEYAVSHLSGAVQVDPHTQDFEFLKLRPDATIVTYCSVGYRSSRIATQLQQAGYENVMNLEGSIFEWANQGRPVYRQNQRVQQVHPYDRLWGYLLRPELHAYNPGETDA